MREHGARGHDAVMKPLPAAVLWVLICVCLGSCRSGPAPMRDVPAPAFPDARRAALEADLATARRTFDAEPDSEDAAIWVARRLGYLGRYREAIDVLTRAAEQHPRSYRVLRHRGHRWITVRRFDLAIADLSRAWRLARAHDDQIEPDGAPTPGVPPRSTDHSNILYHWGLAHYLRGEYAPAERLFAQAAELPLTNDDNRVSCGHWRYLSLMRLGREQEAEALLARFTPAMDVRENGAYHRLLLRYREPPPHDPPSEQERSDPAFAYGVAAHLLLHARRDEALRLLTWIVERTNPASFGSIAAEVDLAMLKR